MFYTWIRNAGNGIRNRGYIAWTQFVKAVYVCFETDTHYLGRLTKLRQIDTVEDLAIEQLAIRGHDRYLLKRMLYKWSEGGDSKQVLMSHPTTWLEASKRAREAQVVVNAKKKKPHLFPVLSPLWHRQQTLRPLSPCKSTSCPRKKFKNANTLKRRARKKMIK